MKPLLVVIDMQRDFITGTLGTPEAQAIVPAVCQRIQAFPSIFPWRIACAAPLVGRFSRKF